MIRKAMVLAQMIVRGTPEILLSFFFFSRPPPPGRECSATCHLLQILLAYGSGSEAHKLGAKILLSVTDPGAEFIGNH